MIELYQHRSYARCISEGYKFLADNLWLTTKVMGPYFLIVSMILVLFNAVNVYANVSDLAGQTVYLEEAIASVVLLFIVVLAYIGTLVKMYRFFKKVYGISEKKQPYIKKVVKTMFHHFWKFFGTTILSLFLFGVTAIIPALLYIVCINAYFSSVEGQVNFSDTALIPISGYILIFFISTLCYYIINMFSVAFYATEMYLYGSIKAK